MAREGWFPLTSLKEWLVSVAHFLSHVCFTESYCQSACLSGLKFKTCDMIFSSRSDSSEAWFGESFGG